SPAAASINFRRGNVDILLQEIEPAETIVKLHVSDDVRLIPMLGMKPALRDHALRGEVNDVVRFEIADAFRGLVHVAIQVELLKAKLSGRMLMPQVRKKNAARLGRTAEAKHLESLVQQIIDKMTARKRIASQNDGFLCH